MVSTRNYSWIWIKSKIFTYEKNSDITEAFFVVEIVPKDQSVEVLYPLKLSNQVHICGV
jgi:hypothetical protein